MAAEYYGDSMTLFILDCTYPEACKRVLELNREAEEAGVTPEEYIKWLAEERKHGRAKTKTRNSKSFIDVATEFGIIKTEDDGTITIIEQKDNGLKTD